MRYNLIVYVAFHELYQCVSFDYFSAPFKEKAYSNIQTSSLQITIAQRLEYDKRVHNSWASATV